MKKGGSLGSEENCMEEKNQRSLYKSRNLPGVLRLYHRDSGGYSGKRDDAARAYLDYGAEPLIAYTNKGGSTNLVKNPALILWDDLNKSALAYWRDLGLTPAGLKKIDDAALKKQRRGGLMEALAELGG